MKETETEAETETETETGTQKIEEYEEDHTVNTSPIWNLEALKKDYPRIYQLFRKYSVFPATQNRDERIFSMIAKTYSRNVTI